MKSAANSAASWVLVLMAASSLFSMVSLLEIDKIVNQDLYRYGLQFSYRWAMPYWTLTKIVFAMGLFNIIAAITFQIYIMAYRRKEAKQTATKAEQEILKTETKPTEKIEEPKEQASKPTKTAEAVEKQPKETPVPVIEAETHEKKEETRTVIEDSSSQGQTEPKQSEQVEEQKEKHQETHEKSEETTPAIEETQQQTGTSVL